MKAKDQNSLVLGEKKDKKLLLLYWLLLTFSLPPLTFEVGKARPENPTQLLHDLKTGSSKSVYTVFLFENRSGLIAFEALLHQQRIETE